jgi:Ca2+-binding RTX toxin-like protein
VRDPVIAGGSDYLNSLVLGPGIMKSDVKFRLGSLVVDLGGGDSIHFEGFNPDNALATPVLASIQFADGQVMTYQEILAQGITIDGTDGDDSEESLIEGTRIRDLIDAKAGNDVVLARGGDDEVLGGAGDDELDAGEGDDGIDGGAGADTLLGGAGADTLSGGAGDDVLEGGGGNDTLAGGEGVDTYVFQGRSGIDVVTEGEVGRSTSFASVPDLRSTTSPPRARAMR